MIDILIFLFGAALLSLVTPFCKRGMIYNITCILIVFVASVMLFLSYSHSAQSLFNVQFSLVPAIITLHYNLDLLALKFIILLSALWALATLYAWSYLEAIKHPSPKRFMFFYNVSVFAALTVSIAANLQTMFIHYELLTLSTVPLIAEIGTEHAEKSLKVYLGYLLSASLCLFLPAIILVHHYVGHGEFADGGIVQGNMTDAMAIAVFIMMLYGAAKTALMPAHHWLPAAMVAYHPVSALLHAVAVVNVGLFCLFRIVGQVFGMQYLQILFNDAHHLLLALPVVTVIGASIIALHQDTIKKMLAYSTISQLSMVIIALFLFAPNSLEIAFIYMMIHSINKIGLFFCAGNVYVMARYTRIAQFAGINKFMPLTVLCFTISGLSLIGIPPLAGFWAKYNMLIDAATIIQNGGIMGYITFAIIIMGTVITAYYILSVIVYCYDKQAYKAADHEWQIHNTHTTLPLGMKLSALLAVIGAVFMPLILYLQ